MKVLINIPCAKVRALEQDSSSSSSAGDIDFHLYAENVCKFLGTTLYTTLQISIFLISNAVALNSHVYHFNNAGVITLLQVCKRIIMQRFYAFRISCIRSVAHANAYIVEIFGIQYKCARANRILFGAAWRIGTLLCCVYVHVRNMQPRFSGLERQVI